jgi:hypothetical protein
MQAELELQIAAVIREVDGNNTLGASALAEHIATTLLSRFVLCDAEPVAWHYQAPTYYGVWGAGVSLDKPVHLAQMVKPLYAPASLTGNADIGTEGGK